jgi:hypothetical protein
MDAFKRSTEIIQDDIVKHISGPLPVHSKFFALNPSSSYVALLLLLLLLRLLVLIRGFIVLVSKYLRIGKTNCIAAAACLLPTSWLLATGGCYVSSEILELSLLFLPNPPESPKLYYSIAGPAIAKHFRNSKTLSTFVPKMTKHRGKKVPNVPSEILENLRSRS